MPWRYAVTRDKSDVGGYFYEIREIYTDKSGEISWTAEPVGPHGETLNEITEALIRMTSAAQGPVLDLATDPPEWINPITARRRDREASHD